MAKSDYLENILINAVLRNTAYTSPTTIYIGLSTADPLDAGSGMAEPTGNYARQSAAFDAPSNGASANSAAITFGAASASWGTITHFAAFDAVTAGNMLYHGILTASKVVGNGDSIEFAAGNLTVTEA